MRVAMIGIVIGVVLGPVAGSPARAADLKPRTLESHITSIALFKNGLAFVTREAALPRGDARIRLENLPVPVHGTFWAWSPGQPDAVHRIVASLEPRIGKTRAVSLGDFLLANVGREVEISFGDGKTLKGRVVAPAPWIPEEPADPTSLVPGRAPILIATSDGTVAFDAGSAQRVQVIGAPPAATVDRRPLMAVLDLEATGEPDAKLDIVYLSRGASWAPSYSVELIGNDRARVTAKAEIINELEDLDATDVKLVTGYPNVAFSAVDDPLAMRGDLASFLAALGAGANVNAWQGGMLRQNIAYDRAEAAPSYSTQPPAGERVDEVFLYPLPRVSLAKGARAYVPLFSVDAAAQHLYELGLDDRVRDNRFEPAPAAQAPLEIWHRVRLTNSGTVPWTTGPAMATRGGTLVAQDALDYAPAGGTSTLRITRVSDLHADADEFEVARKPRALEVYGRVYDEITVRGVAEVASYRDEDVMLSVSKNLTGAVVATTPEGKVDRPAQRLFAVNPSSTIHWTLPLKARSKVRLEYRYTVYIQI